MDEVQVIKLTSRSPFRKRYRSKFLPTHYHFSVISHVRPNWFKLRFELEFISRPSYRKQSSKIAHFCHYCGAARHTHPKCFKLKVE